MLAFLPSETFLFLSALVVTAMATPVTIKVALRIGLVDRPAPHKYHQRTTPYLGGVAVTLAVLATLAAGAILVPDRRMEVLAVAFGGLAVAGVGLLDDWFTLAAKPRLAVQAVAALGLWAAGIRITATGSPGLDLALLLLVVLSVTNAVNLLDNMDGISTGTVAIAAFFFFIASYDNGQRLVPILALSLAGACLGFLPFNFNPARIFLGDAGALFLGFMVAALALKLQLPGYPAVTRVTVAALILAVPLFDMALVVISRWRGGRPIFRGATDHSSHRLVALGASQRLAALATYATATITGAAAVFLIEVRSIAATWAVLATATVLGALLLWRFERVPIKTPARVQRAPREALKRGAVGRKPVVVSSELVPSGTLPQR